MPPWTHRRKLVYLSWFLGASMIVVGMFAAFTDYSVASELVIGGVAIITIPLTAYVSWATLDDRWHFNSEGEYDESEYQ